MQRVSEQTVGGLSEATVCDILIFDCKAQNVVFAGEATALNNHLRFKSTESVAIAGYNCSHQTISRDHIQADHHSNQGRAHKFDSTTEHFILSHCLHCGPTE